MINGTISVIFSLRVTDPVHFCTRNLLNNYHILVNLINLSGVPLILFSNSTQYVKLLRLMLILVKFFP